MDNASQDSLQNCEEVVHYLLQTHATEENISLAIVDLNLFSQDTLTETDYANAIRSHAMACGNFYGSIDLLRMYVAGLHESIQGSSRQFYVDYPRPLSIGWPVMRVTQFCAFIDTHVKASI